MRNYHFWFIALLILKASSYLIAPDLEIFVCHTAYGGTSGELFVASNVSTFLACYAFDTV
jgi:hypothetical protein